MSVDTWVTIYKLHAAVKAADYRWRHELNDAEES